MSRKPYTGGQLNILNGKTGISAPNNSVSVSALVRAHKPKSASELEHLISSHINNDCECGIVSKGTVQDFGRNLFNAQLTYWNEFRFSLQECIQWEYDLFVLQMLKGTLMEDKCRKELCELLPNSYSVKDTNSYVDEDLRVDLEIRLNGILSAGIQVKPNSFKNVRSSVKQFNINANSKYPAPVYYISYDYDSESFDNIHDVVKIIVETENRRQENA